MATMRARGHLSGVLPLLALVLLVTLVGCSGGGGGSASTASGASTVTSAAETGRVSIVVKRDAAKQAGVIPSATTAIRVTVVGTSIVQTVDFPPGASQVEVVLEGVPIGTRTLLVEALQGTEVLATGRIVVEVTTNTVVESAVTLVAVSPTPTPTASPTPVGAKLSFSIPPPPTVAAGYMFGDGKGNAATIEVSVYDANGNLDIFNTDPVTIGLAANPAGATLTSLRSLTATPVGGKATFFSLSIATPASALTVVAKNSRLSGASQPFDCVSATLRFTSTVNPWQQSNLVLTDDLGSTLQAAVVDATGTVIPYVRETATLVLGPNPGAATVSNGSAALRNGLASFPDAAVVGVTAPCGLQVSTSTQASSPVTIDVLPTTTTGAIFVGAEAMPPATGERLVMYDVRQLQPKYVDVAYRPMAMVVGGGTYLYVGGDDANLHVYSTVDLSEVATPFALTGVPKVMRQDPATGTIYIAETGSGVLDIVNTTNAPATLTKTTVTGLTNVHAIGVSDPGAANPFLLDIAQVATSPELQMRLLSAMTAPTSYGTMFNTVTDATLDFTKSNQVGLMTYGSNGLPATFNPSAATTSFATGGFANGSQRRVDVRFYKDTSTPALVDGTCLVANDLTGQVEVAYLQAVLPQPNASPPVISSVQAAADPRGLVNASGAEYIALEVATDGVTSASAFVTDPSRFRLLVLDLAPALPQIVSSVAMPGPGQWSPTAITTHQMNVPSTH